MVFRGRSEVSSSKSAGIGRPEGSASQQPHVRWPKTRPTNLGSRTNANRDLIRRENKGLRAEDPFGSVEQWGTWACSLHVRRPTCVRTRQLYLGKGSQPVQIASFQEDSQRNLGAILRHFRREGTPQGAIPSTRVIGTEALERGRIARRDSGNSERPSSDYTTIGSVCQVVLPQEFVAIR